MTVQIGNMPLLTIPAMAALIEAAPITEYEPGEVLCHTGEPCSRLAIIMSGQVRVHASDTAGSQVILYRLNAGAICPLSLSALLQNRPYPAVAIAETRSQIRHLSGPALTETVTKTPDLFRAFLDTFATYLYEFVHSATQLGDNSDGTSLAHPPITSGRKSDASRRPE